MSEETCIRDEIRNVQVKSAVYPSEKLRIEQLAQSEKKTVSNLIREQLLKMLNDAKI